MEPDAGKIKVGRSSTMEFRISGSMVRRFASLTGDRSSLHTDDAFARRSLYRSNVVHGMLPIMFILALDIFHQKDEPVLLRKLSARFIKPVFTDAVLSLEAGIVNIDKDSGAIEVEYALKNEGTGAALTTGSFTLGIAENSNFTTSSRETAARSGSPDIIKAVLHEQELDFEEIEKGDEDSFEFTVSDASIAELADILKEGLVKNSAPCLKYLPDNMNTAKILAVSMFSTFVGMCMPGKHATFTDFIAQLPVAIERNKKYVFKGKVAFKSQSARIISEDIMIYDPKDIKRAHVTGKINTKVNEPAATMPSIEALKSECGRDLGLKDKVVLVTGASRGIGETTAKLFSIYGSNIIINYNRGKEDALKIANAINDNGGCAIALQADVSNREQVKEMVHAIKDKYGRLDILVNNAVRGANPVQFMELTWEDIEKDIDVIVKGAFNCCQESIPLMLKSGGGKIINISTIFTDNPPPDQAKYVIAKSGLVGLTRSLAVEFAVRNIQVNMVVPSLVETDLTRHISKMFLEKAKGETPMKRNATSADVAKAVVFLASSLSSFTTGQRIMVTGGIQPFL